MASDRTRIRRGPAARPRATVRPTAKANAARKKAQARGTAMIPIPARIVRRIANWSLTVLFVAAILGGMIAMKLPQMLGTAIGEAIGRAGFSVERIEIKGIEQMARGPVYDIALDQQSRAMPLVDLAATREKLLNFGWIADARVSRRLPDTLVVDIVERVPAAIWQHRQRLHLIDTHGTIIAPVAETAMPDLPIVIGPMANRQLDALTVLTAAAPALRPMLAGATWVGGRRWDLRFQSGETLALPEGRQAALDALKEFAARDQAARLLGQGFVRFDMRIPGRMVVRVSREPGHRVVDDVPPVPAASTGAGRT